MLHSGRVRQLVLCVVLVLPSSFGLVFLKSAPGDVTGRYSPPPVAVVVEPPTAPMIFQLETSSPDYLPGSGSMDAASRVTADVTSAISDASARMASQADLTKMPSLNNALPSLSASRESVSRFFSESTARQPVVPTTHVIAFDDIQAKLAAILEASDVAKLVGTSVMFVLFLAAIKFAEKTNEAPAASPLPVDGASSPEERPAAAPDAAAASKAAERPAAVPAASQRRLPPSFGQRKAFTKFCLEHDKLYATEGEWMEHFDRWQERSEIIDKYNAENGTSLTLTANADLPAPSPA